MSRCLILFIGESFREGGQFSRIRNTKDSFEKQQIASLSQIDFLNYIKNKFSCTIDVIINTYTTIYENDLKYWYDKYLINYISNDKLIGLENLLNNGIKSVNIDKYDFILSIRIDLYIKYYFFIKFDISWNKIMFPFICWITEYKQIWDDIIFSTVRNNSSYKTFNNEPVVCDTIIFIPKKYFYLIEMHIYLNHDGWHNFKENHNLTNNDLDFMIDSFHDADSYKDYNPFYYMISRSQNKVCHGKYHIIDRNKFSTNESYISAEENIVDIIYYNEDNIEDNKIESDNIEDNKEDNNKDYNNYNLNKKYQIKIVNKNRNNIKNGFILNNDYYELNKYYYSNNSRLLLYNNNHLYFEKKDTVKKDYNWFGFEINEGVYYIDFEIKIFENISFYEKIGLKIHYPYEIIYNYFFNDLEKDKWTSVRIPINIKEKQFIIFIFDDYLSNIKLEIKNFNFAEIGNICYYISPYSDILTPKQDFQKSVEKNKKENIVLLLYENPNNIFDKNYSTINYSINYSINYTNINKMIIEPFSNIYNIYIFIAVFSNENINNIMNCYKPYDIIKLDNNSNINNMFIKSIDNINYFSRTYNISFNFLLSFTLDSIFKKNITNLNFYINKFNFISYYIPYIDNKISNNYNFISIPYKYIDSFYNLIEENINNNDVCYSIYYYLTNTINKSNFNFIYDDNYSKNMRTPLIKYLSDYDSNFSEIQSFTFLNNNGYLFNNDYLYNIYYSNNYSRILKNKTETVDEFYFYKKKTLEHEKYQWIGLFLNKIENIDIDNNIIINFDIKFLKKININNTNNIGLKIHEPLYYINDWINIPNNNLNIYKNIEIKCIINKKSQYIIFNFDNYLEEVEFYIKNFKIILEYNK